MKIWWTSKEFRRTRIHRGDFCFTETINKNEKIGKLMKKKILIVFFLKLNYHRMKNSLQHFDFQCYKPNFTRFQKFYQWHEQRHSSFGLSKVAVARLEVQVKKIVGETARKTFFKCRFSPTETNTLILPLLVVLSKDENLIVRQNCLNSLIDLGLSLKSSKSIEEIVEMISALIKFGLASKSEKFLMKIAQRLDDLCRIFERRFKTKKTKRENRVFSLTFSEFQIDEHRFLREIFHRLCAERVRFENSSQQRRFLVFLFAESNRLSISLCKKYAGKSKRYFLSRDFSFVIRVERRIEKSRARSIIIQKTKWRRFVSFSGNAEIELNFFSVLNVWTFTNMKKSNNEYENCFAASYFPTRQDYSEVEEEITVDELHEWS